jgi:hypothetical protein
MAYLFYVRTFGELAQVLERGSSFPAQLPEVSHINPPGRERELAKPGPGGERV